MTACSFSVFFCLITTLGKKQGGPWGPFYCNFIFFLGGVINVTSPQSSFIAFAGQIAKVWKVAALVSSKASKLHYDPLPHKRHALTGDPWASLGKH